MNIFITGSEGFVGKNLKEFFLKTKHTVIAPKFKDLDLTNSEKVKVFFKENKVDCIVNCATVEQINKAYASTVVEDNLKIFFNLIEYKKILTKFINLGSGSEYSRLNWIPKMKEEYFGKHVPDDSHSFSKFIQSKFIENSKDKNLYHLRLFGIFGKYEDYRFKFISNTIAKCLNSIPIIINQNCIYDYIFIDDFCKIIKLFVENNFTHKIFNITPTSSTSLISIVKIVQKKLNFGNDIKILKKGFGKEYTGNNSRLTSSIGRFKFSNYEDSVASLISFYKKNTHKINKKTLLEDKFLKYAKKIN